MVLTLLGDALILPGLLHLKNHGFKYLQTKLLFYQSLNILTSEVLLDNTIEQYALREDPVPELLFLPLRNISL